MNLGPRAGPRPYGTGYFVTSEAVMPTARLIDDGANDRLAALLLRIGAILFAAVALDLDRTPLETTSRIAFWPLQASPVIGL